jgi:hypothetical protein
VVILAGDSHGRALDFRGVVWPWGGQDEHGNGGFGVWVSRQEMYEILHAVRAMIRPRWNCHLMTREGV